MYFLASASLSTVIGYSEVIAVVIEYYDLGFDSRLFERRARVVLHERGLLLGCHQHTGIVLRILRLILERDGVDSDTFSCHCLNILYKVIGKCLVVFRLETSAFQTVIVLHPGRCRPRAACDLNVRIEFQYFFQYRDKIFLIQVY